MKCCLVLLLATLAGAGASASSLRASTHLRVGSCICVECKRFKMYCSGKPVSEQLCKHAKGQCQPAEVDAAAVDDDDDRNVGPGRPEVAKPKKPETPKKPEAAKPAKPAVVKKKEETPATDPSSYETPDDKNDAAAQSALREAAKADAEVLARLDQGSDRGKTTAKPKEAPQMKASSAPAPIVKKKEADPDPDDDDAQEGTCDYDLLRNFNIPCTAKKGEAYNNKNDCFKLTFAKYTGPGCYGMIGTLAKMATFDARGVATIARSKAFPFDVNAWKKKYSPCFGKTLQKANTENYLTCFQSGLMSLKAPSKRQVKNMPSGFPASDWPKGARIKGARMAFRLGSMPGVKPGTPLGTVVTNTKFLSTSFLRRFYDCGDSVEAGKAKNAREVLFLKSKGSKCRHIPKGLSKFGGKEEDDSDEGEGEVLCMPGSQFKLKHYQKDTIPANLKGCKPDTHTFVLEEV